MVQVSLCVRGQCIGAASSLCYACHWRVHCVGYPHPLDARDDATSPLSRNGTTQADPSRNVETNRLRCAGEEFTLKSHRSLLRVDCRPCSRTERCFRSTSLVQSRTGLAHRTVPAG